MSSERGDSGVLLLSLILLLLLISMACAPTSSSDATVDTLTAEQDDDDNNNNGDPVEAATAPAVDDDDWPDPDAVGRSVFAEVVLGLFVSAPPTISTFSPVPNWTSLGACVAAAGVSSIVVCRRPWLGDRLSWDCSWCCKL